MTLVERLRGLHLWANDDVNTMVAEAADEIERLEKALETATGYAERLAVVLMEKHFPDATTWKPLSGDLIGILTQIDNLTTGLCRKGEAEE